MIKNLSALEVRAGERIYKLVCEIDSPLGEVHDVLVRMRNFVVQRINESNEKDQPEKECFVNCEEE